MSNNCIDDRRKEIGSFFESVKLKTNSFRWCNQEFLCFTGSGTDALKAIVQEVKIVNPRETVRIFFPSYYCLSVIEEFEFSNSVHIFPSMPQAGSIVNERLKETDIVILPEYFGHQSDVRFSGNAVVVLDKTHDPLSSYDYPFKVDYVFGSLRKVLPIPDGGFYFSQYHKLKVGESLTTTMEHRLAADLITTAMEQKQRYLKFETNDKESFLETHKKGETLIGSGRLPSRPLSDESSLAFADLAFYKAGRLKNNDTLRKLLINKGLDGLIYDSFLYFILKLETEMVRDCLKRQLISKNIFPSVLWPADKRYMTAADIDLSSKVLVIPTDFRYHHKDMAFLAYVLQSSLRK